MTTAGGQMDIPELIKGLEEVNSEFGERYFIPFFDDLGDVYKTINLSELLTQAITRLKEGG